MLTNWRDNRARMVTQEAAKSKTEHGSIFIETIVVLFFLTPLTIAFWYYMSKSIAQSQIEVANIATHFAFSGVPHDLELTTSGTVSANALPIPEMRDYLESLHRLYITNLRNGGSFSDPTANVMIEFWDCNVDSASGLATPDDSGNLCSRHPASRPNYTGPSSVSRDCFGQNSSATRQKFEREFNDFVQNRIGVIRSTAGGTNPLPVGEPIIETTLGSSATGGGSTTFSFYLNRRSFIAVGACVSPPRVFSGGAFSWIEPSSDPVFEVFTFLAPVEAS